MELLKSVNFEALALVSSWVLGSIGVSLLLGIMIWKFFIQPGLDIPLDN